MTRELPFHTKIREVVQAQVEKRSVPFTLKSGMQSHVYCDLRPVVLDGYWCAEIASLLLRLIPSTVRVVGGPALGGAMIAQMLNGRRMAMGSPLFKLFISREPKDHGKPVETLMSLGLEPAGKKIVLVEDVVTTGGSVAKTAVLAHEAGMEVVAVLAIVNRSGRDTIAVPQPPARGDMMLREFHPLFELDEETGQLTWNAETYDYL